MRRIRRILAAGGDGAEKEDKAGAAVGAVYGSDIKYLLYLIDTPDISSKVLLTDSV